MRNSKALLLAAMFAALPLAAAPGMHYATHSLALENPPAQGGLAMDYIAYDRATGMVWAPVSNQGTLYVVDAKTEDEARAFMETLPLAKEQLMDHEYIPVGPLMPLKALNPGALQ